MLQTRLGAGSGLHHHRDGFLAVGLYPSRNTRLRRKALSYTHARTPRHTSRRIRDASNPSEKLQENHNTISQIKISVKYSFNDQEATLTPSLPYKVTAQISTRGMISPPRSHYYVIRSLELPPGLLPTFRIYSTSRVSSEIGRIVEKIAKLRKLRLLGYLAWLIDFLD